MMCDDGCSDCKKFQSNALDNETSAKLSEETDEEKILEVFGKLLL